MDSTKGSPPPPLPEVLRGELVISVIGHRPVPSDAFLVSSILTRGLSRVWYSPSLASIIIAPQGGVSAGSPALWITVDSIVLAACHAK